MPTLGAFYSYAHSSMMFKTGDLGGWQEDGTLAHHGRADDQIKVKACTQCGLS